MIHIEAAEVSEMEESGVCDRREDETARTDVEVRRILAQREAYTDRKRSPHDFPSFSAFTSLMTLSAILVPSKPAGMPT